MKKRPCKTCDGCGKVANDGENTAWTMWASLPLKSALAVTMGFVKPIPCPDCYGLGDIEAGQAIELLDAKGYTGDQVAEVMRSLNAKAGGES